MVQAQVIEETTEEILTWLQKAYSGRTLRITIEPNETVSFKQTRLSQECAKLDPTEEQALADTGLASEVAQWSPY